MFCVTAAYFGITCCPTPGTYKKLHDECFPITIPEGDDFFAGFGQNCMEFVRSMAAPRRDCTIGYREQLNEITAYIDAR